MAKEYDYKRERGRLNRHQKWWGKRFEKQLEEYFEESRELIEVKPILANGGSPDFLIEDAEKNRCYVEAKIRHQSFAENKYFDDWLVGRLREYDAVDGKGIGLTQVSGTPKTVPDVDGLVEQISEWLSAVDYNDLREQTRRGRPRHMFALAGSEVTVEAARAHNSMRLLAYSTRGGVRRVAGQRSTPISNLGRDVAKKYTPELLNGAALALAVLNLSDDFITESDIYGNEYVTIDRDRDTVVESGFNGLGIWHGNDEKEGLATLHGVWLWDRLGASPHQRPTLYANLDIQGLLLPQSLYGFKHLTRGQIQGQQVLIQRGDGEKTYRPDILNEAWDEYLRKRQSEWEDGRRYLRPADTGPKE